MGVFCMRIYLCGYIYEDNIPFENLSEDWTCPICGEGKSVFYLQ